MVRVICRDAKAMTYLSTALPRRDWPETIGCVAAVARALPISKAFPGQVGANMSRGGADQGCRLSPPAVGRELSRARLCALHIRHCAQLIQCFQIFGRDHGVSANLCAIQRREIGHTAEWAFCATESAVRAILGYEGSHCSIRLVSSERRVRHCTPLFVVVRSQIPCVPICSSFETLCRAKRGSSSASDSSRPRMPPTFASTGWLALCVQRSGGLDHLSMIRSQAGWRLRYRATHEDLFHRSDDYSIARWMCSR